MVKNVRSSKAQSHLSLPSTTTSIAPGSQVRDVLSACESDLDTLSIHSDPAARRRAAEYTLWREGQSGLPASSTKPDEVSSSPQTSMNAERHSKLGMLGKDAKPKSLFEAFSEGSGVVQDLLRETADDYTRSLYQRFTEELGLKEHLLDRQVPFPEAADKKADLKAFALKSAEEYTQPFCEFLTENPTVFHAVDYFEKKLVNAGFEKVCITHIQYRPKL